MGMTLCAVHRADDDEAERRIVDVDEVAFMAAGLVEAEGLVRGCSANGSFFASGRVTMRCAPEEDR